MTNTANPKNINQGRNVKRFREMMQMKQDALAYELGEDWNQQKVSILEQKKPSMHLYLHMQPKELPFICYFEEEGMAYKLVIFYVKIH